MDKPKNPGRLTIATRGSQLALAQAGWVKKRLEELNPGLAVELMVLTTRGDKILDAPLAKVGGKGLFVKEIEDALLDGRADLAVHSMKDVPVDLPGGLAIAAVTEREDPSDALVSRKGLALEKLPPGARVGTSSLRRQAQLLAARPDLEIVPLRGNVDTRLAKLETQGLEAIVLAAAGLKRLGLEARLTQLLKPSTMLPAIGQGALGLECRQADEATRALIVPLNHEKTRLAVTAERAFLARLDGGCQTPLAALAKCGKTEIRLTGLVADTRGTRVFCNKITGPPAQGALLGRILAEDLLSQGAEAVLRELMEGVENAD